MAHSINILIKTSKRGIDIRESFVKHLPSFLKANGLKFEEVEEILLVYKFKPKAIAIVKLCGCKKIIITSFSFKWKNVLKELKEA